MQKLEYGIVLTGGIASGKSSVCKILCNEGFEIIDADKIAHEILKRSKGEIVKKFGEGILENGEIDRSRLGKIVFDNQEKRIMLENILHPKIFCEILSQAKKIEQNKKFYFLDIPLFFETGGRERYFPFLVVSVYVDREVQIQRLMFRNKLSKSEALKRVNAQISLEDKRKKSDFVIENNGNLEELLESVKLFLQNLEKNYPLLFPQK
ncbi:dephospho-CoA kinase [Helicobacter anatolicus]|uniref:dephospho-CoA kinase n=1 Tax=Helicobacter anatolicus TaxID=2905874 RepID=UPI001E651F3C|nr:dephospho-CoA kinase [Helicobacter anatolicus]MCE3038331.1 dephospho-CoA kinase [Helicobacter anatolicus]